MKVVDLNVLLYAINRDAVQHKTLKGWWESALNGDEPIGLAWVVLLGFLRLSTSARVFPAPLTPDEALARVDTWLGQPIVKIVVETEEQWRTLRKLLERTGMAGNLTTDAHLASIAITYGATLVSCDADFARFPQLQWENPLA